MANKILKTLTIDGVPMDVNFPPNKEVYSNSINQNMPAFTRVNIGSYTINKPGIYLVNAHGYGAVGSYTGDVSFSVGIQIGSDSQSQIATNNGNVEVDIGHMRMFEKKDSTNTTVLAYLIGSMARNVRGSVNVIRIQNFE